MAVEFSLVCDVNEPQEDQVLTISTALRIDREFAKRLVKKGRLKKSNPLRIIVPDNIFTKYLMARTIMGLDNDLNRLDPKKISRQVSREAPINLIGIV